MGLKFNDFAPKRAKYVRVRGAKKMKALFFDDRNDLSEGFVVREFYKQTKDIDDGLCYIAKMKDGQEFVYKNAIFLHDLKCPKCQSNEHLVFKGDMPDKVSSDYVGACLQCEEDFYLFELQNSKCDSGLESITHNFNVGDIVTATDDRDIYEEDDIEAVMRKCEGKKLIVRSIAVIDKQLVHYLCVDTDNNWVMLDDDETFGFIDADLVAYQEPMITQQASANKLKFSTVAEGLAKIKEVYINGDVTEGEFADYLVHNYDECFDSTVEPVIAIRAIQEFRQWDYEMEGEDAIETFGGVEALSENGYYGFIFMRNGQSMQLPDGVRVGIQTEDGGIALDEGITACYKEAKCFNANDYTTRKLVEKEFEYVPHEHKNNMFREALQLVEKCGYTVGEAANEVFAKYSLFFGLPQLSIIRDTFLTYVGKWANGRGCRTGENRANGSVTYLMDGLYLYEFKTREDAFKYLYDDDRSVPYAMAEYDEELTEANGECSFGEWEFHNGFQAEHLSSEIRGV